MKFSVRPQYRRMQAILAEIRRGTYPNCSDFMKFLEVSRPTVTRDLDFLKTEWKAPVEYDASRKGYFLSDRAWHLPSLRLDRSEVFALGIAQKLIGAFRGTPLEEEMHAAMARVAASLEGQVSIRPEMLTHHLSVVTEDYAPQDERVWSEILRRVEKSEQIMLDYQTFRGERKSYCLDPYHLAAYHGDWYLLAFHHDRKKTATFAVSRMEKIRGFGLYFTPPENAEIQEHLQEGFGISSGEKMMKVRLRFSPSVAPYVTGRVWHPTQEVIPRRDGSIELKMQTRGWKELVRFILSWIPDVEVLAPAALRDRIREKLDQARSKTSFQ